MNVGIVYKYSWIWIKYLTECSSFSTEKNCENGWNSTGQFSRWQKTIYQESQKYTEELQEAIAPVSSRSGITVQKAFVLVHAVIAKVYNHDTSLHHITLCKYSPRSRKYINLEARSQKQHKSMSSTGMFFTLKSLLVNSYIKRIYTRKYRQLIYCN